jgi:hypothetical protein
MIIVIPPTIVNSVLPKFYQNRALWEARELPSRIYGWIAFCTAQAVAEIPMAIIGATIYWLLWYWPSGLPSDSSTSGYVYLMTVLFVSNLYGPLSVATNVPSSSSKPVGVSGSALSRHHSRSSPMFCHFSSLYSRSLTVSSGRTPNYRSSGGTGCIISTLLLTGSVVSCQQLWITPPYSVYLRRRHTSTHLRVPPVPPMRRTSSLGQAAT